MSSLAEQLKKLSSSSNTGNLDPESAYSSLDSLSIPKKDDPNEGKEHYLNVGPSRLRMQLNEGEEGSGGTLRGVKYDGMKIGRNKIFDDDEDEDEDGGRDGGMGFGEVEDSEEEEGEDEDEEGDEDDDEELDEDEDEDGEEDGEEEDGEEDEDEEEDEEEDDEESRPKSKSTNKSLDPMASLRDSRAKDIEKGIAIRRQKALFETLLTLRITFQKALSTSSSLPQSIESYPQDPEGEISTKKAEILKSLGELNERLFTLRENLSLPSDENNQEKVSLGKRNRNDFDEEHYWAESAQGSLALSDSNHNQILPILHKWSSKIQAASLQLGSKQAGGSKFLQSVKNGSGGVVEAIEVGLANKRDSDKTLMESEESGYRSLLREVIESRSGSGPAADLTHLRKEKKKKREAERGGSKGRKLRYTIHEKAQNFVVPIPLSNGWHEEQIDELFSSLFGGVGLKGAIPENNVTVDVGGVEEEGLSGLGGLRVF